MIWRMFHRKANFSPPNCKMVFQMPVINFLVGFGHMIQWFGRSFVTRCMEPLFSAELFALYTYRHTDLWDSFHIFLQLGIWIELYILAFETWRAIRCKIYSSLFTLLLNYLRFVISVDRWTRCYVLAREAASMTFLLCTPCLNLSPSKLSPTE